MGTRKPNAKTGERLFLTLGCLACHTWRDPGASGWLGGGDLTQIADKRPPGFFAAWLTDPARLNRDHRMPVYSLSNEERTSLALFLAGQGANGRREPAGKARTSRLTPTVRPPSIKNAEGRKLVEQFRCLACHRLPDAAPDKVGATHPDCMSAATGIVRAWMLPTR